MKPGTVGWIDLTVDDAEGVREFYERVVGWESSRVSMDSYDDYSMHPPGGCRASLRDLSRSRPKRRDTPCMDRLLHR